MVVVLELHILAVMSVLSAASSEMPEKSSGLSGPRDLTVAVPVKCSTVKAVKLHLNCVEWQFKYMNFTHSLNQS